MKRIISLLSVAIVAAAMLFTSCNNDEPANGTNNKNNNDSENTETGGELDIATVNKVVNVWGTVYEVILKDGNRMYFGIKNINEVWMGCWTYFYASNDIDKYGKYDYKGNLVVPSHVKLEGKTYTVTECWHFGVLSDYDYYNDKLISVHFPKTIEDIDGACEGCIKLTKVTFADGIALKKLDFYGCTSLESITVPDNVTEFGSCHYCSALKTVVLNDRIIELPGFAFAECTSLKDINLSKVIKFGAECFTNCKSLKAVDLYSATELGMDMFKGCDNLEKITLGPNIKELSRYAIDCKNLKDLYCYAENPPKAWGTSYSHLNFVLHVPAGSITAYRNSAWGDTDFGDRTIVAIEE